MKLILRSFGMTLRRCAASSLVVLAMLPGCGKMGSKSVVVANDLVPADVAAKAIELYDANKDGKIDAKELEKSPALVSAVKRIDGNKDGALSAEEIAARITQYQAQSDLLPVSLRLDRAKQPLANAEVAFEPEPFMGDNLPIFKGVSDDAGSVSLAAEGITLPGLPLGLYRVHITGPATAELGCEVSEDGQSGRLTFSL